MRQYSCRHIYRFRRPKIKVGSRGRFEPLSYLLELVDSINRIDVIPRA